MAVAGLTERAGGHYNGGLFVRSPRPMPQGMGQVRYRGQPLRTLWSEK